MDNIVQTVTSLVKENMNVVIIGSIVVVVLVLGFLVKENETVGSYYDDAKSKINSVVGNEENDNDTGHSGHVAPPQPQTLPTPHQGVGVGVDAEDSDARYEQIIDEMN